MKKNQYKDLNIKGTILDKDRLCDYLEKIASEQIVRPGLDSKTYPIPNLTDSLDMIYSVYNLLNEQAKLKITIEPAGEWILDNLYIVEETVKYIQKELSLKKYKSYFGLANGKYIGFARIYVLAYEIIAYTDGKIDEDSIKSFLAAYQKRKPLTIDEIWDFHIFLKIAIIQNIREICEKIYQAQIKKYKAESMIERLVDKKSKEKQIFNRKDNFLKIKNKGYSFNLAFIEYLSFKLKSYGKKGVPYLNILEEQVNRIGYSIDDVVKQAHFQYAVNKVSIGNLITSLKEVSRMDFADISKQIGGIEEILSEDPANVYNIMDYNTKSDYQNRIREISRKSNISEMYIAKTLVELCNNEKQKDNNIKNEYEQEVHEKKKHIGFYLYDGIDELYKKLKINKTVAKNSSKAKAYMAINIVLPLYLCFFIYTFTYLKNRAFLEAFLLAILMYIPFTEIINKIVIYILSKITKPKRLPRLDYSYGIPEEASTFVVIPTIVPNAKKARELIKKLEVFYLANKSDNIYFAVLGDVTSRAKGKRSI